MSQSNCLHAQQCARNGATVRTVTTSDNPVLKILVIVRDEPIVEIAAAMLRTAGYECDAVSEQIAILHALKRVENYNLLFCQVAALEEKEWLLTWALGAGRNMPIVATAARSPGYIPEVICERCTFLQAPFDREQLLNIVRDSLNAHD